MDKKWKMAVVLSYLILGIAGFSRADDVDLDIIVVTASGTSEDIKGTTSDVTVIGNKELKENNFIQVKDAIKETIGMDVVQTGSFGGSTSLFLRGTSPGQSRIMIDNVRVYDPIAADASYDMAHLTLDNVDRIEVVRGPQSVLYGSDAMGGVVNIITKKGKGKPTTSVSFSDGTYDSRNEAIESSGRIDDFSYSFSASHYYSRGISKLKDTSERDPYDRTTVALRSEYDINTLNTVGFTGRFTDANYEYDDSFNLRDDPNLKGRQKQMIFSNFWENRFSDFWKQKLQFSYMGNFRRDSDDKDADFPSDYLRDWYNGEKHQIEWKNTIKLHKFDTLVCGLDWQRESGEYYYYSEYPYSGIVYSSETHFPKVFSRTKGAYLENLLNIDNRLHLNTGIRVDDHSYAGRKTVYKADTSYLFNSGTKIKGGWGTAYKVPTLYQLHAEAIPFMFGGGNKNLQPEESQSYEVGFEQDFFKGKLRFGSVYFHTQLKNIIDAKYDPVTFFTPQYSNVSKARIYGYENTISINPVDAIKIDVAYTWQDTEDKTNGDELLRRPKNKVFLNFAYAPSNKLNINFKLAYIGRRSDVGNLL
ncbi:MAG: TonB-dependent receptor, partial [Candidatus Omnitrophica bacterium]|nr:TonB-dependent receptor [Candidatus Omnitrophota bacterium]